MAKGVKVFPRGKNYRSNFDRIFNHQPNNPCQGCYYNGPDYCTYEDGDCIALENDDERLKVKQGV